jgi:hypothetical protein
MTGIGGCTMLGVGTAQLTTWPGHHLAARPCHCHFGAVCTPRHRPHPTPSASQTHFTPTTIRHTPWCHHAPWCNLAPWVQHSQLNANTTLTARASDAMVQLSRLHHPHHPLRAQTHLAPATIRPAIAIRIFLARSTLCHPVVSPWCISAPWCNACNVLPTRNLQHALPTPWCSFRNCNTRANPPTPKTTLPHRLHRPHTVHCCPMVQGCTMGATLATHWHYTTCTRSIRPHGATSAIAPPAQAQPSPNPLYPSIGDPNSPFDILRLALRIFPEVQ